MRAIYLFLSLMIMSACDAGYGQPKEVKMCLALAEAKDTIANKSYPSVAEFEIDIMKAIAAKKSPENAANIERDLRQRYAGLNERDLKKDAVSLYGELSDCYNKHLLDWPPSSRFSASRANIVVLMKRLAAFYVPQEKAQFLNATHNRRLCSSIAARLFPNSSAPNKNCVYSVKGFTENLVVMQSVGNGILVKSQMSQVEPFTFKTAFISNDNTKERNVVDGALIEPGIFEYTGVVTYPSLLGPRSVYSFRRIEVWKDGEVNFYSGY